MNQLQDISAGMKGGEVSTRVNGNMYAIKTEIERLESLIKTIQGKLPDTSEVQEEVFQGVSIVALPETSVLATSNQLQTTEVPINVYYGRNKLSYKSYDDGKTCYAVDLGTTNIYNTKNVLVAQIGAKTVNDQLVLLASISANVNDVFSYEFEVIFNNVRYKKLIGFNVFESEAQSALNIDFSPSTVIITESYSGGTLEMKDAKCTYSVYLGNNDVTDKVTCSIENGSLNCSGSVHKTNNTISIDSISAVSHDGEGCQLFKWTDINGVQHSQYKATSGYLQLLFTYTNDDGIVYRCLKNFNFAVNYLGTFKESIVNDVHEQVSEKVVNTLTDGGLLLTESARTEIIQSAEQVAISAARESVSGISNTYLEVTAEQFKTVTKDIEGNTSQIKSNAQQILLALSGVSGNAAAIEMTQGSIDLVVSGLTKTGINIQEGEINVSAGTFNVIDDETGKQIAVFDKNGGFSTEIIKASDITAKHIHVSGDSGSYVDIDGYTGTLKCKDAYLEGTINAKDGVIGGFKIKGHSLTNDGFNNDAYIIMRDDPNDVFIGLGTNIFSPETGVIGCARIENTYTGPWTQYFERRYGLYLNTRGAHDNISISLGGGCIGGFAILNKIITDSISVSTQDSNLVCINSSEITLTLPKMESHHDGHVIFIKKVSDGKVNIKAQECNVINYNSGSGPKVSMPVIMLKTGDIVTDGNTFSLDKKGDACTLIWARDITYTVGGASTYYSMWLCY